MIIAMKKILATLFLACHLVVLGGCQTRGTEIQALYPRSAESFVGDPMPYFNGKEFRIYYLEDLRDGQIGFHPFSLLTTQDFYNYQDEGEVIPFVNEVDSPERGLGTGSIIQDRSGTYHAFYTGHNGELEPKEVIMHATSRNGIDWEKIPEHTFEGDEMYEKNDFRDPYVFWEAESQRYWMLITTRQNGQGIIAKYTSEDLTVWQNEGPFFVNDLGNDSNLECPSLVEFNGVWYLAFSDQWDQRVVHYRYADSPSGPFKAPDGIDHVDGAGFYAGRLETDGNQLYLVGWIPTKESHHDRYNYNWAGNLAVHQLQVSDTQLVPHLPEAAYEQVTKDTFETQTLTEGQALTLDSDATILNGKISVTDQTKLALEIGTENVILLDFESGKMSYYNTFLDDITRRNPQSEMALNTEGTINFSLIQEDDIVVIYDGKHALSNRIYQNKTESIKLTVVQGSVDFE